MPEYSGTLSAFELAALLWLTPLVPLLAAGYALFVGHTLARGPASKTDRKAPDPSYVGLRAALICLALVAYHGAVLASLPESRRMLVSHAWNLVRIGSLDSSFTLSLEPATAVLALAVTASASLILAFFARGESVPASAVAGIEIALSGVLFVLLADDWVFLTLGSTLAGLGALVLGAPSAEGVSRKSFVIGRLGDAFLLAAGAVFLWGLGGSWTGAGDYVPDFRARLIGVELGEKDPAAPRAGKEGPGYISMAALPGATITLGGAQLCAFDADGKPGGIGSIGRECREVARSPFSRIPVGVALHDFEITSGAGTHDLSVQKLRISAGGETLITSSSATLVLREMRAALAVRDANGSHPIRAALSTRRVLGAPLMTLVASLLAIAFALRGAIAPLIASLRPSESADQRIGPALLGLELVTAGAILARTDFLLLLSARVSAVCAALFAIVALIAALRAAHAFDSRSALVGIAASNIGLAGLAFCAGAYSGGVLLVAINAAAISALALAVNSARAGTDLRALGGAKKVQPMLAVSSSLSAAALAGAPLPLGVVFARDAGIGAAAQIEVLGFVGWLATITGIVAAGFTAFSVWRLHYLVFAGARADKNQKLLSPPLAGSLTALSSIALALGVLGVSSGVFGNAVPALLERWLPVWGDAASAAPVDRSVRLGLLGASFVISLAGWALARGRYRSRDEDWLESESGRWGHAVLARAPRAWLEPIVVGPVQAAAGFLVNFDLAFERLANGAPISERTSIPVPSKPPPAVTTEPALEKPRKKKKKKKKRGHR